MYRERRSRLAGAVVWGGSDWPAGSTQRVLPDGCMDLMWLDGTLLVAGPDTTAQLVTVPAGPGYIGLRFPPGAGPAVLRVAAHELRDQRVPLADLWPTADVRRLTGVVENAPSTGAALEEIALDRLDGADTAGGVGGADRAVAGIAAMLGAGATVTATARAVGLGERQLHRRCLAAFGYGPKTLARILRMNRALRAAHAGTPLATVAAAYGYADQPHLARDVKQLTGVPIGVLTHPEMSRSRSVENQPR
jgi:AraC-like DNA-binding protein